MSDRAVETIVSLRPIVAGDYEMVARWLSNPEINRWLGPWRNQKVDRRVIGAMMMNPRNRAYMVLAGNQPCGVIALKEMSSLDRSAQIWAFLGESDLGSRGIMTAALKQFWHVAFHELGLRSIQSHLCVRNAPSTRMCVKAGFRTVGVFRKAYWLDAELTDLAVLEILPEDVGLQPRY